jgi:EH domain-containing protein 1
LTNLRTPKHLRDELIEIIQDHLTPAALRYEYSNVALETSVKWRPIVLILGNYSSGKSTLINELIGMNVQATGQAPTDDSFTVITRQETNTPSADSIAEREGYVLLNDPAFPFESLKRHGQRFAAHFRLKQVQSDFLQDLAIIDTPGMLDSIAERDRGYDYQQIISDLAQLADLIIVMFDPHKAGTVRESYESLRRTLPESTFEDRLVFVLNRIDECASLNDFVRVYGTLCWNLSQMLGRKDIPKIMMTYSDNFGSKTKSSQDFLKLLQNERSKLAQIIQDAPRHRLDHLASYIEAHGQRLEHFLEAVMAYARLIKRARYRSILTSGAWALLFGSGAFAWLSYGGLISITDSVSIGIISGLVTAIVGAFGIGPYRQHCERSARIQALRHIDRLTSLKTQTRQDTWAKISDLVSDYLENRYERIPIHQVKQDLREVRNSYKGASKLARAALSDYRSEIEDQYFNEPIASEANVDVPIKEDK